MNCLDRCESIFRDESLFCSNSSSLAQRRHRRLAKYVATGKKADRYREEKHCSRNEQRRNHCRREVGIENESCDPPASTNRQHHSGHASKQAQQCILGKEDSCYLSACCAECLEKNGFPDSVAAGCSHSAEEDGDTHREAEQRHELDRGRHFCYDPFYRLPDE